MFGGSYLKHYSMLCCITEARAVMGGAENDGHENDGPSKLQGMKLQDMKIQDMKLQDMTRIDSILLNFSFFSCIVMLTLQQWNCVM